MPEKANFQRNVTVTSSRPKLIQVIVFFYFQVAAKVAGVGWIEKIMPPIVFIRRIYPLYKISVKLNENVHFGFLAHKTFSKK